MLIVAQIPVDWFDKTELKQKIPINQTLKNGSWPFIDTLFYQKVPGLLVLFANEGTTTHSWTLRLID